MDAEENRPKKAPGDGKEDQRDARVIKVQTPQNSPLLCFPRLRNLQERKSLQTPRPVPRLRLPRAVEEDQETNPTQGNPLSLPQEDLEPGRGLTSFHSPYHRNGKYKDQGRAGAPPTPSQPAVGARLGREENQTGRCQNWEYAVWILIFPPTEIGLLRGAPS